MLPLAQRDAETRVPARERHSLSEVLAEAARTVAPQPLDSRASLRSASVALQTVASASLRPCPTTG